MIPGSERSTGEGIGYPLQYFWSSLVAQLVKNPPAMWDTWVRSLGWEDPLEKGMASHSSILAWRSMGPPRVGRDWTALTSLTFASLRAAVGTAGPAPPRLHPAGSWVLAGAACAGPRPAGLSRAWRPRADAEGLSPAPSSQFFRKYLTPEERADLILISLEALTKPSRRDARAASRVLRTILKSSVPDIGKVAAPGTPGPEGDLGLLPFHSVSDLAVSLPTGWG